MNETRYRATQCVVSPTAAPRLFTPDDHGKAPEGSLAICCVALDDQIISLHPSNDLAERAAARLNPPINWPHVWNNMFHDEADED